MAEQAEFRARGSLADFHSITFELSDGSKSVTRTKGISSFDVNDEVTRDGPRGVGRYKKGLTTGEYDGDLSLEWLSDDFNEAYELLKVMPGGFYGFKGNMTLSYTEKSGKPVTVVATDIQFKNKKRSGKQGSEGFKITTDLDLGGKIYENGVGPFGEKL